MTEVQGGRLGCYGIPKDSLGSAIRNCLIAQYHLDPEPGGRQNIGGLHKAAVMVGSLSPTRRKTGRSLAQEAHILSHAHRKMLPLN